VAARTDEEAGVRRRFSLVTAWLTTAVFLALIAPLFALPYPLAVRASGLAGRLLLPLSPAAGRVRDNLALLGRNGGPRAARRLTAQVGDSFGRVLAEYIRMGGFAARPGLLHVHGGDALRAALKAGRGAIIVSAHFGNWEAIRLAGRGLGVEVGIIYRPFNNPAFNAVALGKIAMAGGPVLYKGAAGLKQMVRHLRGGGAILILLDQRLGDGAALPFMGRTAHTATSVAALAQRMGAPLIPAVGQRRADGLSFDVTFEPPIVADAPDAAMRAVNARFEAWIDRAPEQWFWLHRRWKWAGDPVSGSSVTCSSADT